ncbi:M3 family metallopeptidase [Methanospirillum hungatei]|uniref:M3 family metallopeptidase n=1 Tax=Methanospirillum hungatei TaxID=2203 RepID=UPI0026EAEF69|nr:M3 family metallopeptidase [Methanospirillum hungatei]MCA1916377.1 M3 family metallopeptidase [Methanospirillum hungatei]
MENLKCRGFFVLLLLLPLLFNQVSGDRIDSSLSVSKEEPAITFPLTVPAIDDEVHNALSQADQEIASLLSLSAHERNETNTILRLEEILTRLDSRLLKYQTLASLYPDQDLQNAAFMAAEKRDTYIRNLSSHDELYRSILETKPTSEYGRWLYDQETRFFRFGGALRSEEEKTRLSSLYQELGSLQNQYIMHIRENHPLTENLNTLTKIAILRNSIASLLGYATWTDLTADEQGWRINRTDISSMLDEITPLVKELVKPVTSELLQRKRSRDPIATEVFDYETDLLITSQQRNKSPNTRDFSLPFHRTISRTIALFSCFFGVRTELVADARAYAPRVLLFRIADEKTHDTKGWFYLDLEERPGKTKEWMTALIAGDGGVRKDEGSLPAPVFIVSGTSDATIVQRGFGKEEYSLLFHELGHLYTRILAGSAQSSSQPAIIPVELTEASSHLFEYLAFSPEILSILMAPKSPLETQNGDKIMQYSIMSDPYAPENRLNLGKDMAIGILDHRFTQSPDSISFGEAYAEIYTEITGVKSTDHGGYLLRSPHLTGDTAGMYWIYPVGQLYAMILFSKIKESGILNRSTWDDFIHQIILPADTESRSEIRLIHFLDTDTPDFLDRGNHTHQKATDINWSYVPGCIERILSG